MNFTPVGTTGKVEGFALLKKSEVRVAKSGQKFLTMILSDNTGEIDAKYWDYREGITPEMKEGSLVKVSGFETEFKGMPQLKVEMIRPALDSDRLNPGDFVPTTEYDPEHMYNEICRLAKEFKDPELAALLLAVFGKYREQLLIYPAAVRLHHAMRGGLLYHSLSIIRLCEQVAKIYPQVDSDLLITGAALHDIGKCVEMDADGLGVASRYTTRGNLLGHLVIGAMIVDETGKEMGISEDTLMLVEHMLLSHHGKPEYGAAVPPKFLEASILAKMDELDANLFEINDNVSAVESGEFTQRIWALDNIMLYNHGRMENTEPKANLFRED